MSERDVLARLAVEQWKLLAAFERVAIGLPPERVGKVGAQLRYSRGQLDMLMAEAGLQLSTFDGHEYSAELPVSPVNADDLTGEEAALVDSTLEPTVLEDGRVIRLGKVILRGA